MRMHLSQIEALHWIARLGSFRAAARHLHITQPTISARVRDLERALDAELFDRRSYRARLTARGRDFAALAERIVAMTGEMERRSSRDATLWGTIRMGVCDTFAMTGLADLLARIERAFPEVQVDLDIDHSVNLDAKLQQGQLDCAFLTQATPAPRIVSETLSDLALAWVASPRLKLPHRRLTPADLRAVPVITNPRPSLLHRDVLDWFAAAGETPVHIHTCTSLGIMTRLAVAGAGVTLLPLVILQGELKRGQLRVLSAAPVVPPHPLAMAYVDDPNGPDLGAIRDLARAIVGTPARATAPPPRSRRSS